MDFMFYLGITLGRSPALHDWLIDCFTAHQHRKAISAKKRCKIRFDQDMWIKTTVYEEMLTGRPHDTSVQKTTRDNANVDYV